MAEQTTQEKKEFKCESCDWRQKYIDNPRSFSGILWKLHSYICPGWRGYQKHLKQQGKQQA